MSKRAEPGAARRGQRGQGTATRSPFTVGFLALMAVPLGLMLLAGVLAGRANGRSMSANFARFGYAIIPLDMAAHIAHNLSTCWPKARPSVSPR